MENMKTFSHRLTQIDTDEGFLNLCSSVLICGSNSVPPRKPFWLRLVALGLLRLLRQV